MKAPVNASVKTALKVLVSFVALVSFFAFAQDTQRSIVINPQSIVVNPLPQYGVDVWVDRDPSGSSTPTYYIGDPIQINVRVSENSYVYLFNVRSSGEIVQIFPNRFDGSNYLYANQTKSFPGAGARYRFSVDGPTGIDKVIAVASKRQLNTSELASFKNGSYCADSQMSQQSFAQTLSIIVEPLPQNEWVTDTINFQVARRYASMDNLQPVQAQVTTNFQVQVTPIWGMRIRIGN
ncbi:MAG: DUF4384 domain-containing protein [Deinococcales bacterium]